MRLLYILFFYTIIFLLAGCTSVSPGKFGEAALNDDYYFIKQNVQVQGSSTIPPATDRKRFQPGPGKNHLPLSLSLDHRRRICVRTALRDAQARWLALTIQEPADYEARIKQLELPFDDQDWAECMESTAIRRVIYDSSESCRIVAIIPCHPLDY